MRSGDAASVRDFPVLHLADLAGIQGHDRDCFAIQRDESRHIRFGVYMLQVLLNEEPTIWSTVDACMNRLIPLAIRASRKAAHSALARGERWFAPMKPILTCD